MLRAELLFGKVRLLRAHGVPCLREGGKAREQDAPMGNLQGLLGRLENPLQVEIHLI